LRPSRSPVPHPACPGNGGPSFVPENKFSWCEYTGGDDKKKYVKGYIYL
jgi:hypothetical protein